MEKTTDEDKPLLVINRKKDFKVVLYEIFYLIWVIVTAFVSLFFMALLHNAISTIIGYSLLILILWHFFCVFSIKQILCYDEYFLIKRLFYTKKIYYNTLHNKYSFSSGINDMSLTLTHKKYKIKTFINKYVFTKDDFSKFIELLESKGIEKNKFFSEIKDNNTNINEQLKSKLTFKIIIGILLGIPICAFLCYIYILGAFKFYLYMDHLYDIISKYLFPNYNTVIPITTEDDFDFGELGLLIGTWYLSIAFLTLYTYIKLLINHFRKEKRLGMFFYFIYFVFIFSAIVAFLETSEIYPTDIYEKSYFFEYTIIATISLIVTFITSIIAHKEVRFFKNKDKENKRSIDNEQINR
ncbi:putative membrane protein [Campylobacter blaseri]|uniref:Uncharacterized protein n=1 Tax=Campylobacter blaseri TaxID=2042961 RepID=A0A2P8R0G8_9BACT|nr:hypothetical protein [Campylobacter blaseri]PSM51995.1 hypothetical protein CQ405_05375 [Campylobacter blaseri]PSM53780.1 hypothetical protein CRN67_05375 [Campylobacter blaseri]QKF85666.1 putative membrane protein [Campylobacter blaseri]